MVEHEHGKGAGKWKHDGVRVVPGDQLDPTTAQTPGMFRQAAINHARVGAQKIWAGTVTIRPDAKTGAHHHGALESVIYVVRGKARMVAPFSAKCAGGSTCVPYCPTMS